MAEQKKPQFFDCPNCGDKRKVIGAVRDEEVAKGKFRENVPLGSGQKVTVVFDPQKPALSCPVVKIIYDVCAKCGFESPREVHYGTGQPQMVRQGGRQQGPSIIQGRGN